MHDQKLIKQQRTPNITKTSKLKHSRNLGVMHNQSATTGMLLGGMSTQSTKRATLTEVLKDEPLPKSQTRQDVYLRLKMSEL